MPREFEPMPEEKERKKFGRNVFQRDIYFRHGEKLPTGELAPAGFEQAKIIGKNGNDSKRT